MMTKGQAKTNRERLCHILFQDAGRTLTGSSVSSDGKGNWEINLSSIIELSAAQKDAFQKISTDMGIPFKIREYTDMGTTHFFAPEPA